MSDVRLTVEMAFEIMQLENDAKWLATSGPSRFDPHTVHLHFVTVFHRQEEIARQLNVPTWTHAIERAHGYMQGLKDEAKRHKFCRLNIPFVFQNTN